MSTLTLRLDSEEAALVERLKDETGHQAASKALLTAGAQFLARTKILENRVNNLQKQLDAEVKKNLAISQYFKTIRESEEAIRALIGDSKNSRARAAAAADPEVY